MVVEAPAERLSKYIDHQEIFFFRAKLSWSLAPSCWLTLWSN